LPRGAPVRAAEPAVTNDEGVQPIHIGGAHREAVDVGARQVVKHRLPRGAAISAYLKNIVPREIGPSTASDRQAHRLEVASVDERAPRPTAVISSHDAVVVAEEGYIRVVGTEGEGVEIGS